MLIVQAFAFAPELATAQYRNNDSVSHFALIQGMADAVEHGDNPLDFWSAETTLGLPLVRTYQPLAHMLVVAVYFALGKSVSLLTVFLWAKYLSMVLLPAAFYLAMELLDFPPLAAAATALLAPMIAGPGPGHLGVEIRSWMAFGAYPQTVGAILLLLSLGVAYRTLQSGKRIVLAGALIGLTLIAHLIYGWMAALTVCLMAVLPNPQVSRALRIRRTAMVGAVAFIISLFQLVPLFTDGYLINRSTLEPAEKYDSFGMGKVLGWLFSGQIMDHDDRFPALSLLVLFGVCVLIWRYRKTKKLAPAEVLLLSAAGFWLIVFFGRPTWGGLLTFIGATPDLHLHRVIGAVQIFFVMIAGVGLALLWRETARRWHVAASVAITLLLLWPMASERDAWLQLHERSGQLKAEAVAKYGAMLNGAIDVAAQRGGRVYADLQKGNPKALGTTPIEPVDAYLMNRMLPTVSAGYNVASLPADLIPTLDPASPTMYRVLNIRTVIEPRLPAPAFLQPLGDQGAYRVLAAPGEGYFGLVDVVGAAEIDRESFKKFCEQWLRGEWPEKNQYVWLDLRGDAPKDLPRVTPTYFPATPPATPAGTVSNDRQKRQVYEADLDVTRPAWTLFRMSYHPAWKLLVDGQAAKTAMLTPGFIGAQVAAGHHHVVARYEPGNWKVLLALAGLVVVLLLGVVEWRVGFKFAE